MKNTIFVISLVLFSCARPTTLQAQTTRYTDGSLGSNCIGSYNPNTRLCSGGTATAYTTVNGGMANTASGDTLLVRAGTYNERINNAGGGTVINSGTDEAHRTIIKSYQTEVVWLQYNPGCGACTGVNGNYIADKSYVTIDGLNVDNDFITPRSGTPPLTTNATGSAWHIDDNVQNSGLTHHITLTSTIPNTRVQWKNGSGGIGGGTGCCTGSIFTNIEIFNHYDNSATSFHGGYGTYVCYVNSLFENILVHDVAVFGLQQYVNHDFSVAVPPCRDNVWRNNIVYNVREGFSNFNPTGMYICCIRNSTPSVVPPATVTVYNNVVYNITDLGGVGIWIGNLGGDATSGLLANNTVYNVANYGILTSGSGWTAQNNIILNTGPTIIQNDGGAAFSNSLCSTTCGVGLSNQTGTTTTEFGGNVTYPGGFHLVTGAHAIGAAVNLSGTLPTNTDLDGVLRTVPWDIGAYKFVGTPPALDTPPVEDFVYTSGASLGGQNCANGTASCNYWTGPWTLDSGAVTTDAMTNSLTTGNALHSSGTTAASIWRNFNLTSTTGPVASNQNRLSWQARWDSSFAGGVYLNNNANNSVNVINVFGASGGAIHVCEGTAGVFTLHTATAGTSYFYEVELDAAGHAGQFRIRVTPFGGAVGTFTAWTGLCNVPASPGVNRIGMYDGAMTAHDFYVDSIGATATQLAFTTQPPATVNSGATFAANASVTYTNGITPVPGATNSITLAMCPPSSGSATLTAASGLTKAAVNGTASWSDLVLTQPAGAVGLTICASASMLAGGESTTITINATAPPITSVSPARMRARVR